jgi:hypothetical protein
MTLVSGEAQLLGHVQSAHITDPLVIGPMKLPRLLSRATVVGSKDVEGSRDSDEVSSD